MSPLAINTQPCALDFLSLGAVVHRLDPGVVPFHRARTFSVHVSGGEYNVAANLAECFGLRTSIATAMVRYGIGELVQKCIQEMGVAAYFKWFDHDGVRGPNIATVYSDLGHGVRAPVVFYNRANEAAALLKPGDFDWKTIFSDGVRWFHSGGIFAALSESAAALIVEAMQSAKEHGVVTSFDLNYREKLWRPLGGEERCQSEISRILPYVDVLFGNEEDLQASLGISGPAVATSESQLDPTVFFSMIGQVRRKYPKIRSVATTLRQVRSANDHLWSAVMWLDGKEYVSPTCSLNVLDRIGGGDGFSAGLIYGLIDRREPDEALRLGWAHGALLTTFPGDVTMARLSDVEKFARGGSARVLR